MGMEFQFCQMKRVLWMDGGDGCTTMCRYLMPLSWTLKNDKFVGRGGRGGMDWEFGISRHKLLYRE